MIKKYKWKCRLLVINTTTYSDPRYINTKKIYQKKIKEFHKRSVKFLTNKTKNNSFSIDLVGFDGQRKGTFKFLNFKKIFEIIDKMPISKSMALKKIKPINLSLYSDYNPKTTTQGLGFKNKEKALFTVNKIKNRDLKYQVNVVATMLGRAKKHPNKTKEMNAAIKVFNKWMKNYKKNKS